MLPIGTQLLNAQAVEALEAGHAIVCLAGAPNITLKRRQYWIDAGQCWQNAGAVHSPWEILQGFTPVMLISALKRWRSTALWKVIEAPSVH